jgi:hypothetical protein
MTHPTHQTRYSDSSLYDEVCTLCGATDARGSDRLYQPCSASARATVASGKDADPVARATAVLDDYRSGAITRPETAIAMILAAMKDA